jgi:hypothetical protein
MSTSETTTTELDAKYRQLKFQVACVAVKAYRGEVQFAFEVGAKSSELLTSLAVTIVQFCA